MLSLWSWEYWMRVVARVCVCVCAHNEFWLCRFVCVWANVYLVLSGETCLGVGINASVIVLTYETKLCVISVNAWNRAESPNGSLDDFSGHTVCVCPAAEVGIKFVCVWNWVLFVRLCVIKLKCVTQGLCVFDACVCCTCFWVSENGWKVFVCVRQQMTDGPAGRSRGRWMRWQTETDSPLSLHHNPSFSLPLFSFSACRDDAVPLVL